MTLYEYTAVHNPMESARLVSSYGIKPHQNLNVLSMQLAETVKRGGQSALDKVVEIHPDASLFQQKFDALALVKKEETHSNACGCETHSNATGQNIKNDIEDINGKSHSKIEMLIVGGVVLGALALILKK